MGRTTSLSSSKAAVNDKLDSNPGSRTSGGAQDDQILDLLALCTRWLLQAANPQAFIARLADEGPRLFPQLLQGDDAQTAADRRVEPDAQRGIDASRFFRSFAWAVVAATPLPALGFRSHKLPLPGRNEPCLCGSLRKYKHCCADIVPLFPRLDGELLGGLVIGAAAHGLARIAAIAGGAGDGLGRGAADVR